MIYTYTLSVKIIHWWWSCALSYVKVRVTVRVRARIRKLYLTSDSVNSTTLALTWNECGYGPFSGYANLRVTQAPGMPGTFSPPPRVSDPDMHHGTCVTHVPLCLPGSLTSGFLWSRSRGNVPRFPGACATHNFAYLVRGPCRGNKSVQFFSSCLFINLSVDSFVR